MGQSRTLGVGGVQLPGEAHCIAYVCLNYLMFWSALFHLQLNIILLTCLGHTSSKSAMRPVRLVESRKHCMSRHACRHECAALANGTVGSKVRYVMCSWATIALWFGPSLVGAMFLFRLCCITWVAPAVCCWVVTVCQGIHLCRFPHSLSSAAGGPY